PTIHRLMEFRLLDAPGDDVFITSDSPFNMVVPGHHGPAGLAHEGIEATLPLSQKVCLMLKNGPRKGEAIRMATTSQGVETIKLRTGRFARRLIVAPTRVFPGSQFFVDGGITGNEPPATDAASSR